MHTTPQKLQREFERLGQRQILLSELVGMLRQTRSELLTSRAQADLWISTAILANVVIIPLNAILNALPSNAPKGAVKSAVALARNPALAAQSHELLRKVYEAVARKVYAKHGASGTRIETSGSGEQFAKQALSAFKDAAIKALEAEKATDWVPVVKVLGGLAEDSYAALQTMQLANSGSREADEMLWRIAIKIDATVAEIQRLGVQRAHLLDRMQDIGRIG